MGSRLEANSSAVRKRISHHTFNDEAGEEYEASNFGGFNDYFRRKKIKLQNLDAEIRSSADKPPIFRGIVAHVNGYTQPSLNDLHSLIVSHGGGFLQYLDGKTTVTHIIASSLTPKKAVEFRRYRIVKPAWIVESVKAGRLLPWDSFRVLDEGAGQKILNFDQGKIVSESNTPRAGYRDQTDASWYTSQLRDTAVDLQGGSGSDSRTSLSPSRLALKDTPDGFGEAREARSPSSSLDSSASTEPIGEHQGVDLELSNLEAHDTSWDGQRRKSDFTEESLFHMPVEEHFRQSESNDNRDTKLAASTREGQFDQRKSPSKGAALTAEEHNAALLKDPRMWKSSTVNPDFLQQYYRESRLHHLSTWKAELKSQLQGMAEEKSSQSGPKKRPAGSRRYILHVDFDSFFAAVSLRKHPQFIDKPTVVAHGTGTGSEIASCNYPARKYGIKNGMWMKRAMELCQDLKVLPYDFKAYEQASRHFYEAILSVDGVVQSVSIDEALVDISEQCTLAGGTDGRGVREGSVWREQARAEEIAQHIRDTVMAKAGCAVSVGIGGNILLAKVALRKAKPAGQYQIKPEEALNFLGDLMVQDLPGVAYSIGGKLEEIGVKYVKDIRSLTKERLTTALGPKTGEKLWDYARGIDRSEVGEQVVRKSVSAEVNWGIRFVTQQQAEDFVQSLCDELNKRLVEQRVKGRQITMKIMRRAADAPLDPPKHLGHGKCDTYNKSIILGVPTNAKEILGREAISVLRGFGFSPGELRGIGVQMTRLEPLKKITTNTVESSQKQLQFKTPHPATKAVEPVPDPIEDVASPEKTKRNKHSPARLASIERLTDDGDRKPLNVMGTQFVMPTQVDPSVLAELPEDIRSRFAPISKAGKRTSPHEQTSGNISRSNSPAVRATSDTPPPQKTDPPQDWLPSHSQLDPEILDALPQDVRAEILASYRAASPKITQGQSLLPQSPRKVIKTKKITTPTKPRTGRGRPKGATNRPKPIDKSTLTQSNFVSNAKQNAAGPSKPTIITSDISAEFLDALPPDIRQEVLEQQKRDRLKTRSGLDVVRRRGQAPRAEAGPIQKRLRLPQPAEAPAFTGKKLSKLSDLRDAMSAWIEEFQDDGPYEEDVEALTKYLCRVVQDERDMEKAVSVVRWIAWLIENLDPTNAQVGVAEKWQNALESVKTGVQEAVHDRGLGVIDF